MTGRFGVLLVQGYAWNRTVKRTSNGHPAGSHSLANAWAPPVWYRPKRLVTPSVHNEPILRLKRATTKGRKMLATTRPNDEDEYTLVARLTDQYADKLTAPTDYTSRLDFLGDEINNDAVQGLLSDGAESIRDQLIATAHAYYGCFERG
jgi:hypothetical protein